MKGSAIIIVGYQGAGKSLLVKSIARKVHPDRLRILDVNNEYAVEGFKGIVSTSEEGRVRPDFDTFEQMMIDEEGCVFIVEDATVVFRHTQRNVALLRSIISKRHSANSYFFLFHSLRVIPRDLLDYSDQIWLLKTNDSDLSERFKGTGVQQLLEEVRQLPEFEYKKGKQEVPVRDIHFKVMNLKGGKTDKTVEKPDI